MAYVSKTWVDRDSQYPTRRIIVHPDLTEEQVTVRRDEGIVTTQGDVFDANTMNNLEARIAAGIGEKQDTLTAGSGISIDENNVISATGGGGGSSTLAGLDDTNISSPQNGQALIYDATSSKWVNANGGSGSATLAGLTDVTLTNPTADQVLKYDGTKWVNGAGGGDVELSKTISGSVCSFTDGADGLPVKDLVAQVVAVQSGTGDPSPSNVRPISGWANVGVTRAGKNLLGGSLLLANAQAYLPSGTTDLTEKTFAFTSNLAVGAETGFTGGLTDKFKANTQYTLILTCLRSTSGSPSILIHYTDGTTVNFPAVTTEKATYVFVTASGKTVSKITKSDKAGTTTLYYDECGVFEGTLSASQFEPYTGTTVTIALGQTVYGGELDVTSGVLKITHGFYSFDGTEEFSLVSEGTTNRRFTTSFSHDQKSDSGFVSHGVVINRNTGAWGEFRILASGYFTVLDKDSNFATVADLQSYLATQYTNGTPLQVCYELAQPVTVQLTPTEIKTLLGTNNIWHDSNGDTTVTYYTSSADDVVDLVQYDTTKQDKLTAGTGISIDSNNVISATGGGGGAVIDDTTTSTTSVWSSNKTSSEVEATAAQILVAPHNEIHVYYPNELCIYGGHLYQCRVQNQGVFDPSDWVQTYLAPYIGQMVADLIPRTDIGELSNVNDGQAVDGQVLIFNDGSWNSGDIPLPWTEVSGTLSAGSTSITLNSSAITANSTIQCFYDADDVDDPSKSVSTGSITLTFSSARQTALAVKVRVS